MIRIYEKYDPMYIHIDSKDRDSYVSAVSKNLSYPLHTDWALYGSYHNTHDFEVAEDAIEEIPEWIMDFYNHIK